MSRKNKKSPLIRLISLISILLSILLMVEIVKLNILPFRFEIPILGAILLLTLILFIFYNFTSKSRLARFFGAFMVLIVTVTYGVGYFYIQKTVGMISSISTTSGNNVDALSNEMTNNVSVIVMKSSGYESLSDLSGKDIGTTESLDSRSTKECLNDIEKSIKFDQKDYDSYYQEMSALYSGQIDAVILDESSRGMIYDIDQFQDISQATKSIHTTSYKTKRTNTIVESRHPVNVTTEPFTIYFSGNDSYGGIQENARTDSNMLVTINPTTKRILMTSIPRDYYIPMVCSADAGSDCPDGEKDKLTHTGLYGIDTTIQSIEDFMDIDINYYVRVNFSSLVNIVDALGGIDVTVEDGLEVDQFYTNGTVGGVTAGENHLDGEKALAYARERYAYTDGDMQRVKNQQQVLRAIIEKVKSPSMLMRYIDLIDAIGSAVETNMPSSSITDLVRFQLATGADWKFASYPMVGNTGTEYSPSLGDNASVTYQDKGCVQTARKKIQAILDGKKASSVKDKAMKLEDDESSYTEDVQQDSSYYDSSQYYYDPYANSTYDSTQNTSGYDSSYSDPSYSDSSLYDPSYSDSYVDSQYYE